MTSKERVYESLRFCKPDRTPRFIWLGAQTKINLMRKFGVSDLELQLRIGNDVLQTWLSINGEMERDMPQGSEFTDEWGIVWRRSGLYNAPVFHPLCGMDADSIRSYPLPDPLKPERFAYLERLLREHGGTHFIGADVSGVLFEPACHLRGMEEMLADLALGSDEAAVLLDRLAEFCIALSIECIRKGADWIWLGDDLGSQQNMLLSPDTWREHIKPRMRHIINSLRREKEGIAIAYHSCGSMYPVVGDLAEIGIDVLNPIQESARGMSQIRIKKEFGERMTLMCGPDTQQFLVSATPDEVRRAVIADVENLGMNGGYIFAVSHAIQPDTPMENIDALLKTLDSL